MAQTNKEDSASVYAQLMDFINECTDVQTLRDMLIESIDNKDERELFNNYVKTGKSSLETIGDITLDRNYWDCECEDKYIHDIRVKKCNKCGAKQSNQPNSRANEVKYLYNQ